MKFNSPRHVFDMDATAAALHTAGGVQEEDEHAPARYEVEAPQSRSETALEFVQLCLLRRLGHERAVHNSWIELVGMERIATGSAGGSPA